MHHFYVFIFINEINEVLANIWKLRAKKYKRKYLKHLTIIKQIEQKTKPSKQKAFTKNPLKQKLCPPLQLLRKGRMGECDTIFSILSPPKTFPIHHYKLQLLFHRYKVKLLYFTAANNFPILYHYQLFHHHTYIPNHQPLVNVQTKPMFYLLATLQ